MVNIEPQVFDTLTHFVTEDRAEKRKPLGIDGYMSYVGSWSNPNIRAINLLTGACPKYQRGKIIVLPCKWDVRDGRIEEFSYETVDGRTVKRPVETDCYAEVNRILLGELRAISKHHPKLRLFHSPLIHPKRTSVAELEALLEEGRETILGLKVHGIASASGPNDFNQDLARYIAKLEIPLIIHTDYSGNLPHQITNSQEALAHLQRINSPRDWAYFCLRHELRASLQHGARNDKEVYRIIKSNSGQFTAGLGPMIDGQCDRMVEKTDSYVGALFENLGPEYVVFSTDYPFNEDGEDLTKEVVALSQDEQEWVFHRNAEKFFRVKI